MRLKSSSPVGPLAVGIVGLMACGHRRMFLDPDASNSTVDDDLNIEDLLGDDDDLDQPAQQDIVSVIHASMASFGEQFANRLDSVNQRLDDMQTEKNVHRLDEIAASYGQAGNNTLLDELRGQLKDRKINMDGAELALLRASHGARAQDIEAGWRGGSNPCTSDLLEASYLMHCNGWSEDQLKAVKFSDDTISAAMNPEKRGFGPQMLLFEVLAANNQRVFGGRMTDQHMKDAIGMADEGEITASGGASTISLPGILSNVANKEILVGWSQTESHIDKISKRARAGDYKPFYRYRLNTDGFMQQIGADGEFKSIELAEESFQSRVFPFGNKLQMTVVMMRNDDGDAFKDLVRLFGRMAKGTIDQAGYTTLLSQVSTFWTEAKGNRLADGASAALGIDSLGSAYELFLARRDGTKANLPLSIAPKYLLTGTSNALLGRSLYRDSKITLSGDTDVKTTDGNPFTEMFVPLPTPWLDNAAVVNANGTNWLLLADPQIVASLVIAYLDGVSTPQITPWERLPGKSGMQWDMTLSFGTNLEDDKGSVYSKGKA